MAGQASGAHCGLLLQILAMPYVRLHMKRYRDYVAREVDHRKQVGRVCACPLGWLLN